MVVSRRPNPASPRRDRVDSRRAIVRPGSPRERPTAVSGLATGGGGVQAAPTRGPRRPQDRIHSKRFRTVQVNPPYNSRRQAGHASPTTRLATEIQSAARLTADVTAAAAAGLGTGVKANVNGFATAVKDAATLGLNPGQLELIGVTKEDRDRGYDTAAAISTASGQILLAVGTGAISSALSKGGTIARTANKALVVYDTAGNAVGVVQGVYDAQSKQVKHRQRSTNRRRAAGAGGKRENRSRSESGRGREAPC